MPARFVAAFLAALCCLAIQPVASAQDARFGDWAVRCDVNAYCVAETVDTRGDASASPRNMFRVGRNGGDEDNWELSILTLEKTPPPSSPATARVAGQRLIQMAPQSDYTVLGDPNEFFFVNRRSLQLLFRQMGESSRLFITFGRRGREDVNARFSLDGLNAALLWIDDKQNRRGSRRRAGPPDPVRVAERTRVTANDQTSSPGYDAEALASAEHDRTNGKALCTIEAGEAYAVGTTIQKLDDRHDLVQVPCTGANDGARFRLYVVNRDTLSASLQLWALFRSESAWSGTDQLPSPRFDADQKILTFFEAYGDGDDCGRQGAWRWQDNRFVMDSFLERTTCDGTTAPFPTIYPATGDGEDG
ncbi:MAG: DUF1176 domain-containing protein [Pseudomonadota bacterium]